MSEKRLLLGTKIKAIYSYSIGLLANFIVLSYNEINKLNSENMEERSSSNLPKHIGIELQYELNLCPCQLIQHIF